MFFGLSAIEIALWDIAGKAANAPLCRLLGGGVGDLKCYASLLRFTDPAVVRANVRRAKDGGFHALKGRRPRTGWSCRCKPTRTKSR